jgi:tetratricopeptide (TPR) repeat protein
MGPEQLKGTEDTRSEIWSLGAVFYEMLTGKACFEGETDSQVITKITRREFKPMRELNPGVPRSLEMIVNKMLEPDPSRRYQGMESLVRELRSFANKERGEIRRSAFPFTIIFSLLMLLAFAGGFFYAYEVDILQLPFIERFTRVKRVSVPETVTNLDAEKQYHEAFAQIEKGDYHLAYQILKHVEERAPDPALREKASYYKAYLAMNYMKDVELAVVEFQAFLKKYPESPLAGDAHFFLGGLYYESKHDLVRAIRHLATVV